ncbi:MAG: phytoene desaturase family protein, partial [Verrucomicrobiota bacterium]
QGTYSSDSMVINADFARAMTSLVPNHLRRRWSDEKLSKKRFSCSTYMLYLGVDQQYDLPHHNICISEDYEQNLRDIEELHQISEQPSFYVQNACVTDPSLAPEGKSALYVLAPVTHQADSVDWKQAAGPLRSKLIQQMAEIGFDNVEGNIITETMITPDDWDQQYNIHLGATFNLAHNLTQMLHLRPRNRFEDLEGVYLVGGGTHPGSGLPVIFESAKITSDLMCQDFSVSHAGSSKKKEEADLSPVVA